MSFKGITFAIFVIIALAMAGLFFSLPYLAAQPQNMRIAICAGAGVLLFAILASVVFAVGRGAAAKSTAGTREKTATPAQPDTPAVDEKAVQVLSILQKKGRLIDFLQEDISAYDDGQIGAAVRNIHKGCQAAIEEYVTIKPVMKETEGESVTVTEGFDPSAVRLTGNVAGDPPFQGTLRHCGWRVTATGLPKLPVNQDLSVIEPAEVEME